MNSFNYEYPVRQHFGKGCAESAIKEEMKRVEAKCVMLACNGIGHRSGDNWSQGMYGGAYYPDATAKGKGIQI